MSYYAPVFGTYTFRRGLWIEKIPMNRNVPTTKLPRADGDAQAPGYLTGRKFEIKGGFTAGAYPSVSGMSVDQLMDELATALAQAPCNFQWRADRYCRLCQASDFMESYEEGTGYGRNVAVSFAIQVGDPFVYAVTPTSVTQGISGATTTFNVTPGGNAYCLPKLSLTVGTGGQLSATITNALSGDSFTLNGTVTAGQEIVVDSLLEQVTIGGVDNTALFDGSWLRLLQGTNALTVTYSTTGGNVATFTQCVVNCQDRYNR